MILVDLAQDKSKINPYISSTLLQKIDENVINKKKTILYLNKRGDFSSMVCNDCKYLLKCKNCDSSLTVHSYPTSLRCHICMHSENIPLECPECKSVEVRKVWIGTQQIENSLKIYFEWKGVNIFRFDFDAVANKTKKKEAFERLEQADIIIGTKMITTGFDFKNVGLIGVILMEQELAIPAYNTEEMLYTNVKQLIGRGQRQWEHTDIVLQSFIPSNDAIGKWIYCNYKEFFKKTLEERKIFNYPPFSEMVIITYRDRIKEKAEKEVKKIYNKLSTSKYAKNYDIVFNSEAIRQNNQHYYKIIAKGQNIRKLTESIFSDIMRNSQLSAKFS